MRVFAVMEWSNEAICDFLTLYRNEPTLWNTRSAEHKNRNDLYEAWCRIKYKLQNGNISVTEIKKKRDNLMSTYRKLRGKVQESMKTCSSPHEIYKPDWPFYDIMSQFLDDIYIPRKSRNSNDHADKEETEEDVHVKKVKAPTIFPKRLKKNATDKRMNEAYKYFKRVNQKVEKDECALYTDLLCKKLRGLQEKTREIAMLEIDKFIFHLKQNETQIQLSQSQTQFPALVPTISYAPNIFAQRKHTRSSNITTFMNLNL